VEGGQISLCENISATFNVAEIKRTEKFKINKSLKNAKLIKQLKMILNSNIK